MNLLYSELQKYRRLFLASYLVSRVVAFFRYGYFFERQLWNVAPAGEKGEGLYALVSFQKGDVVFIARGKAKYWKSKNETDPFVYPNWYGVAKDTWIEIAYPYVKANHSCTPNMGISGARIFIALENIKKGEELVFDYAITDDEIHWAIPCFCNTRYCTGTIGPIQTISCERFLHSYPYIPKHFVSIYKKSAEQDNPGLKDCIKRTA